PVAGIVVRREWHRVRRVRNGMVEEVGGWVSDTVADCSVRTQAEPTSCGFTPPGGGSYTVTLTARDDAGRTAVTTFHRWAGGEDWVPWNDENKLTMDVITDRDRYAAGDTATLLLAAPFTDVEALVTVERERVLWSKRMRVTAGATTLKLPITETFAPNAFVSVVLVRGRSAPPGPLDDPGRPTLRVGYAELRVTPEVKRLSVDLQPERAEYRPRDTATIAVDVRDGHGHGRQADVALWAVDEGVLALTRFTTPDPIDLLYPTRGIAMRLASNLVSVAPQVPQGDKGRAPGGGGGEENAAVLRSRFRPTAFFLGSLTTDAGGHAVARAPLPDNLTTFRVMAVAVTDGDRYGSGDTKMLVSLPLLARPALPRFTRRGDRFRAGVVVNARMPGSTRVRVQAQAEGIDIDGARAADATLDGPRPEEVRFDFRDPAGDSARFRFDARGGGAADAVAVAVPVRPNDVPRVTTVAGLVRDTAGATFLLDPRTDPARSALTLSFGSSVLAVVRGTARRLRVYPYQCSEQVSSAALPLIALYRARAFDPQVDSTRVRGEIETAVHTLLRRQTPAGGIGYWGASDWTTPWLSAYAGRVLLEARDAGVNVPAQALDTLAAYLSRSLHQPPNPHVVVARWWDRPSRRLAERVAAVDLLSRMGRPDVGAENTLLQQAALLAYEDRLLLAMALDRRGETATGRELLDAGVAEVHVDGRTAVLPDSTGSNYFPSRLRAAARLLDALEQMEPHNALIGPLVERLVQQGRALGAWYWTTQDVGWAMLALMKQAERARAAGPAPFTLRVGDRVVLSTRAGPEAGDTVLPLEGLPLMNGADGQRLRLTVQTAAGASVYWYLTLTEHADGPSTKPVDQGISVERWYEDPTTGQPLMSVAEGELVRVRLRVTVPTERNFVVLDDPLPAGLEPVDLSLRTVSPFGAYDSPYREMQSSGWVYGSWDAGMWSPFDHKEMRDDRVVFAATYLWKGVHTATYLARATTAGSFLYPPAHAEEMYNPGVNGRSAGGVFQVRQAKP
ncbi:MAG: alpha-2-macroglobulin family protein, partial [Gemmatimonadota bacterium]